MHIKDIGSTSVHGTGPKSVTAPTQVEEAKKTRHNQTQIGTSIPDDIKIDPSRLPEPARSAPAHVARELLKFQEVDPNAEAAKNFGQLVAKIAKGEQAPVSEESCIQQADAVSSAASDEIER